MIDIIIYPNFLLAAMQSVESSCIICEYSRGTLRNLSELTSTKTNPKIIDKEGISQILKEML